MAILILFAVLNIIFTRIVFSVNIAKTSQVYYCARKDVSIKEIADGAPTTYFKTTERCSPLPFFDVFFAGEYYIQYVIARESRISAEHRGEMDGFGVDIVRDSSSGRTNEVCGFYPSYVKNPHKPETYRVNCLKPNRLSDGLRITFTIDSMKEVADIEVHAPTDKPMEPLTLYRGCMARFPGKLGFDFKTWENCLTSCREGEHAFAAIQGSKVCRCSNRIFAESEISTHKCDKTCTTKDGAIHPCGSDEYYSVFRVNVFLPAYFQCLPYTDLIHKIEGDNKPHPIRVLHNDQNLTIYKCLKYCENATYAFLLNGSTCECGNDVYASLSVDRHCKSHCTGDKRDLCGGVNYTSIYKTCKVSTHPTCSEAIRCKTQMDKYGDCMNHCEYGFIGENCVGRDIKIVVKKDCELDKPCVNRRNVRCILKENIAECICLDGFSMRSGGHCEDIDECELGKCDFETSTCMNLVGSYYCECLDGNYRETNFSCLDNSTDIDGWTFLDGLILLILPILSSAATVAVYTVALQGKMQ